MSRNINLLDIRKPGVTTIVLDSTQEDRAIDTRLYEDRIIIGFSRKGPFNTVTRIESISQREQVYGPIDSFLEKRGSYFHRFIDIALQQGPVLALNLLSLDNSSDGDKVDYQSLSITPQATNPNKIRELYAAFYSKERFWKPSEDNFVSIIDSNLTTKNSIISFVNLGQSKHSIIIKKASNAKSFDIYAQDYFGKENVPAYINPLDKLSDYFVDVYVIEGDYTNYKELSVDPIYGKYFNSDGLKTTAIGSLESSQDFNVVLSVTGSIIPNLFDGSGISHSIDSAINSYLSKIGLFCLINDDYLNSIIAEDHSIFDMVGHSLVDPELDISSVDFLSYKFKLIESLLYTKKETFDVANTLVIDNTSLYQDSIGNKDNGLFSNKVTVDGTLIQANLVPSSSIIMMNNSDKYATLKNYITVSGNTTVTYTHPDKESEGQVFYQVKTTTTSPNVITISGVHDDLGYDMVGEKLYITNGTTKLYYEIDSYTTDAANNKTAITVTNSTNLDKINTNYKVTWASAYKVLSANATSNVVIFKGKWDLDTISSSLTGNVLYLKNNATKTGNLTFDSYTINSNNDTEITVTGANVMLANGAIYDILTLGQLTDITKDVYYVSMGVNGITRPKMTANAVSFIYEPDKVTIAANTLTAYKSSQIYKDYNAGVVVSGDITYKEVVVDSSNVVKPYYVSIQELKDSNGIDVLSVKSYTDTSLTQTDGESIAFGNKKLLNGEYESVSSNDISIASKIGNINERILIESTSDNGRTIRVTSTEGDKILIGQYINSYEIVDGIYKYYLSPVISKKKITISNVVYYDLSLIRPAKIIIDSSKYYIEKYLPYDTFAPSYNFHSLSGFKMGSYHLPGDVLNKDSQLEKILGVIDGTNLSDALKDRNLIDYQYIVDSFDTPIKNEMYPKNILSRLAKNQGKCIALLNGPSIKDFIKSQSPAPVFTTLGNVNRVFDARYIETGGNLDLSPDYIFSLPSETNGAVNTGVFGPNFTYLKSNGQRIEIPPAAMASNLFVLRNRELFDRFKPAAGVINGIVRDPRALKVEYFSDDDLQYLDAIGYNAFINKNGYGITLYGNKTAYQSRSSARNNLHVVDMLNSVERLIENILERYIFDVNTARTRYEVYRDLDNALSPLRGSAFYNYSVKIDSTNNSGSILDGSYGIVEVDIYPIAAIEKFINILNIKKNSGIDTSGFNI